jgi:hypothetical protein
MSELIEDVQKHPFDFHGCPLCFGRGHIGKFTVEGSGIAPMTVVKICPRCAGIGIERNAPLLEERLLIDLPPTFKEGE